LWCLGLQRCIISYKFDAESTSEKLDRNYPKH
jgi:hypothetical protein